MNTPSVESRPQESRAKKFSSAGMALALSVVALAGVLLIDLLNFQARDPNSHSQREAAAYLTVLVYMLASLALVGISVLAFGIGMAYLIKSIVHHKSVMLPLAAVVLSGAAIGILANRII